MDIVHTSDEPPIKRLSINFLKYGIVGVSTFVLDIIIALALILFFGVSQSVALGIGFFIGVSINYQVSYYWVFKGTRRRPIHGYVLFGIIALIGALTISYSVVYVSETFHLQLFIARLVIAAIMGAANFFINTFVNFKTI